MRSSLVIVLLMLCGIPAAFAALPSSPSGCRQLSTLQSRDGRAWEIRLLVCSERAGLQKLEVRERRPVHPAQQLKNGLIW